MAENVQLNPGAGGATLRTLRDADGVDWPVGVHAYAETLADGANVVRIVDASHGLPVALADPVEAVQADPEKLAATVHQGGSWTVNLAGGSAVAVSGTVAATQSGAWTVNLAEGTELVVAGPVALADGTTVSLASDAAVAATQSGTWTVGVSGTVATTQSGAWSVGLEAGSNLVGKVAAGVDGSTVYNGTTATTPLFAKINASASGDNQVVAASTGKKIRVLRWGLSASDEATAKWRSGSTDLTGPRLLPKYAAVGGAYCPVGLMETAAGEALNLNLSAAVAVGGELTYVLI